MGRKQRGLGVRMSRWLRYLYPGITLSQRTVCSDPISLVSVVYVLAVIASGWYLVVPCTLLRADFWPWSILTGLVAAVFHSFMILTTYSYLLACFVDPGAVPESWKPVHFSPSEHVLAANSQSAVTGLSPDAESLADSCDDSVVPDGTGLATSLLGVDVRTRLGTASSACVAVPASTLGTGADTSIPEPPPAVLSGMPPGETPRFCRNCCVFKPPRTHHCGSCNRCALQFDHHCAFMRSSCIGFHNRKFFVLFLGYASLSCLMVALIAPFGVLKFIEEGGDSSVGTDLSKLMFLLLAYMLCLLHSIVLAGFCGYHIYLICRNLTTIEHSDLAREDCTRYNRGLRRNWRAVFGARPMLWLLPVSLGRESDGTRWRFVEDLL
jgi:DHHC palmitoyltransferase